MTLVCNLDADTLGRWQAVEAITQRPVSAQVSVTLVVEPPKQTAGWHHRHGFAALAALRERLDCLPCQSRRVTSSHDYTGTVLPCTIRGNPGSPLHPLRPFALAEQVLEEHLKLVVPHGVQALLL